MILSPPPAARLSCGRRGAGAAIPAAALPTMSTPPRPLIQKVVFPLIALVVLTAVVAGLIRIRAIERGYHDTLVAGADQLSRSLTSATWHAMLADDRPAAYDVMQAVARQPGISRVRIFNKEGRIMFSTAAEAGHLVDKNAEACVLCHASAQPLVRVETPSRARIFRGPDGRRRLAMVTPIYNEPSCSTAACHAHPVRQHVLGVLDVALDLDPVDQQMAAARQGVVVTIGVEALLISAFLVVFVSVFVTRPIHRFIEANAALSRMDLEHPIEISSSRELWDLARSFNAMRERLREALGEITRAAQQLEAKVAERTEQLREAHQRLLQTERLASLGQLAASVAHEINNPLSGVLNFSALMGRILKDDGIPPERIGEFRGYLERVTEQTARAGRVVSDLLAFSRRSKPQRAPADVNAIVRTTVGLVSHKLRLGNVEAELSLAEDLPPLPCDASQLQQVVLNLVINAAEATHTRRQGHVRLTTARVLEPPAIVLEVADDGEGIPRESLDRIFDPFFTTKEVGKGVGLGLAVVYGIVRVHGGEIRVSSVAGTGTTFTVTLPLRDGESQSAGSEADGAPST
jgi:two-component system NtrC family sensor kinase